MAASDTFELEVYDDELGRYVRVPDPSAKSLAVRKQNPKAEQKRRVDAFKADRRRANEAATANIDKLGSGIASIPSRVVNYIKSSSPSSVGRDVKGIARATYDAAVEDPNAFIEDAIASPFAAIRDFGDVRESARKLRAQGRDAEAEAMEAMAGTAILSAVPILGKPAGVATRNAIKAAEKSAVKSAIKGAPSVKATPEAKAAAKAAAAKAAAERAAAIKEAAAKRFSVTTKQAEADKARAAAARATKTKYAAIEPNPNPDPALADIVFPQGAGLGGPYAIENSLPIVGRKPSLAQTSSGYSGLAASTPANRVVADITETEMIPRVIRTPEEVAKEFAAGIPLTGDALINGLINEVNGRPQVGSTLAGGGPNYPRDMAFRGDPAAWASIGSVVSDIDNRRALGEELFGGPVAGVYTRMGNTAVDQTTAMMDLLGRQLDAGGVTKANLKLLDEKVKAIMGQDFAKSFIGFEKDPQMAAAQLNNIAAVKMPQRTAIIQGLDSSNAMMAGFPDIGANRVAATIPELLYAPEGSSGYMISGLSKNEGRREGSNTPDITHPNYPKKQTGEYYGGYENSVPRELMFSDYFKAMYGSGYDPNLVHSYLFSRTPAEIKEAFGRDPRIQQFDQEWIDKNSEYLEAIKKYGPDPYAQGGLAVKRRRARSSEPRSLAVRIPNKKASKARRAGN